jgi:DNA-binding Xre family transcriptional regulator
LETQRGGRVAALLDEVCQTCPEFNDLLDDYSHAKKCEDELLMMKSKGQVLSLAAVKDSTDIFCYYTGLPSYDVFRALFCYLQPLALNMQYVSYSDKVHNATRFRNKPGPPRILSLEDEFFVTLVRLRLGLPSKDLAKRFGIAESTLSVIFNTWVILLARELEEICCMPSVDVTTVKQADCFQNFDNVRIVLDCTEVFSQTPGSLTAHRHMHSNYKHHSTVKFLVGMSPSGAIIYVSSMWGGRASDKKITSESDQLLLSLKAGDKVMVDRGFTVAKELPDGVTLLIPPFKNRGTGQFTKEQLEFSEKISVARIHVERAMRAIKECQILATEVKLAMINNYENIFKACAYLVNFKRPFLKVC